MRFRPKINRACSLLSWKLLACLASLTFTEPVLAQAIACDQGVVRLPDRVGTVQICSAIAGQVPALGRQLAEAIKLLGSQQQQVRELTRLVSAMNGSSSGLDTLRQAQMLRSLSAELARAEQLGPDATRRSLEEIGDQFETFRDRLIRALSQSEAAAATNEALRGRMGDSIAQLELRSATRQLDEIAERLKQLQVDVNTVKLGVSQANEKLDQLNAAVNPANPADRCADLECAVLGNASIPAIQKLAGNGARVLGLPGVSGMLLMALLPRQPTEREQLFKVLREAGLDPQTRIYAQMGDSRLITPKAAELAESVLQRSQRSVPLGAARGAGEKLSAWNRLASCLNLGSQGVSLTELAALLGDGELMNEALRQGFSRPRASIVCKQIGIRSVTVEIAIDQSGQATIEGG